MSLPTKVFQLRYEVPLVTPFEDDTGYPGGDPVEDLDGNQEYGERVSYHLSRSSLARKVKRLARWSEDRGLDWDPPVGAKVLSIEEGTIYWTAPEGHGS